MTPIEAISLIGTIRSNNCRHGLGPAARAMVAMSDVGGMFYSYVALPKRDVLRTSFGPRGGANTGRPSSSCSR